MSEVILEMYRPVLNFPETATGDLWVALSGNDITEAQIRMLGGGASRAAVLGSGDLNRFFEYVEVDPAAADIEGLAQHLEAGMPESADEHLEVPSFPFAVHAPFFRGRPREHLRLFTLGTNNPIIRQERATAISLTEDFFGVAGEDTAEAWQDWDYMAEVWLARSSDPVAIDILRQLLEAKPWLLQESVTLGPAVMGTR